MIWLKNNFPHTNITIINHHALNMEKTQLRISLEMLDIKITKIAFIQTDKKNKN